MKSIDLIIQTKSKGDVMDNVERSGLQAVAEYYRNKCNQLEYEYLSYKVQSELIIKQLKTELETERTKRNQEKSKESKPA